MSEYETEMSEKIRHAIQHFELSGNYIYLEQAKNLIHKLLNEKNYTRVERTDEQRSVHEDMLSGGNN